MFGQLKPELEVKTLTANCLSFSILSSLLQPDMRRELSEAEQQSVSDIAAQLLVQSYREDLSPDLRESLNTHTIFSFIIYFPSTSGNFWDNLYF